MPGLSAGFCRATGGIIFIGQNYVSLCELSSKNAFYAAVFRPSVIDFTIPFLLYI